MRRAGFTVLFVLCFGVAGYGLIAYGLGQPGERLHPDMRATFEQQAFGIRAHVFASALALLLGPFQFLPDLRARLPALHRWMGRVYLGVAVLFGGLAGLYMSAFAFGGAPSKLGFASLALAWLYTGLRAYVAVRGRDFAAHWRWMIRNFALTFAAVTLRLYLPPTFILGLPFETAYPVIAWACWVPNLLVAEWHIRATREPAFASPSGGSAVSRARGRRGAQ